jgi:hypothetical protein
VTVRPWRREKPSIMPGGAAEPPMIMLRTVDKSHLPGCWSSSARIPSQSVGTPAAMVTRSSCMSSSSDSASRCGPGKTSLAPVSAAQNGSPHALAWNIGTTGSTQSSSPMPSVSFMHAASVCSTFERWL